MCSCLTENFWPIFFGSIILAASGPFGFSAISIIVNTWFHENQHATATAIIGLADVAGALATFAIQGILS